MSEKALRMGMVLEGKNKQKGSFRRDKGKEEKLSNQVARKSPRQRKKILEFCFVTTSMCLCEISLVTDLIT